MFQIYYIRLIEYTNWTTQNIIQRLIQMKHNFAHHHNLKHLSTSGINFEIHQTDFITCQNVLPKRAARITYNLNTFKI